MSGGVAMPCCPDKTEPIKNVEQEIHEIQHLLVEAYERSRRILDKVKCKRCVPRILFLVEGLEIFSKMNLFAESYRETADKWRDWIRRIAEEEGLENNRP